MTREDMDFIETLFRSLETQMDKGFGRVDEKFAHMDERFSQIDARLDQMNNRLDRIGGLVNGGARAMARIVEWSEKTDVSLAGVLKRLEAVEERLRKVEGGQ